MINDNTTDKKAAINTKINFFYKKNISFEKKFLIFFKLNLIILNCEN